MNRFCQPFSAHGAEKASTRPSLDSIRIENPLKGKIFRVRTKTLLRHATNEKILFLRF